MSDCPQASVMAILLAIRPWVLAVALSCVFVLYGNLGRADKEVPQTGGIEQDPAQITAKALLCFNDKYIYSSCEESYRLSEKGNLNVPPQSTDAYCDGPCLTETNLVLGCIDNIFINFVFYNKATIQDIKDTITAACGHGPERGNFDVTQHMQAEASNAHKAVNHILFGLGLMIMGHGLLI